MALRKRLVARDHSVLRDDADGYLPRRSERGNVMLRLMGVAADVLRANGTLRVIDREWIARHIVAGENS